MEAGSSSDATTEANERNKRRQRRKRVFWPATLKVGDRVMECRVANLSQSGAKVRVPELVGNGQYVNLLVHEVALFRGRVVWERDGAIGMHFSEGPIDPSGPDVAAMSLPPVGRKDAGNPEDQDLPEPPQIAERGMPSGTARIRRRSPVVGISEMMGSSEALSSRVDDNIRRAVSIIHPELIERIDAHAASVLSREELRLQLIKLVTSISKQKLLLLSGNDHAVIVESLLDEMLGLGPIEPLLADDSVTDILVNGAHAVYVERRGKLELTDIRFQDDQHVMNIAVRIVTKVGRRIDATVPLVDARLPDGSRVNIIVPPLALRGPMISIRKFAKKEILLPDMVLQENLSTAMAVLLKIATRCRLNTLISGGTGAGKTTLLNAMSQMIDPDERIITIEDAAELQLQLPHVGSLETRPTNVEGKGEISIRDLFKNALRMRPDRIILGEIRGDEAFDMLQAMNSGHDGSLGTIHASGPEEALGRLESIIALSGIEMPARTVRAQIATAIDLIVQVRRMPDGKRRVTSVTEVVGIAGDEFVVQELFAWRLDEDMGKVGEPLTGRCVSAGVKPHFTPKAEYAGFGRLLTQVMTAPDSLTMADLSAVDR